MWQLKPQTKLCTDKKKRTKSPRTVKCHSDMIVKNLQVCISHLGTQSLNNKKHAECLVVKTQAATAKNYKVKYQNIASFVTV